MRLSIFKKESNTSPCSLARYTQLPTELKRKRFHGLSLLDELSRMAKRVSRFILPSSSAPILPRYIFIQDKISRSFWNHATRENQSQSRPIDVRLNKLRDGVTLSRLDYALEVVSRRVMFSIRFFLNSTRTLKKHLRIFGN